MTGLLKKRRNSEEDTELNMIPIMNIFLVIIPFLLTSVSFFHIKAINTSVPVMANSTDSLVKQEKIKLTVIVEMRPAELRMSATSNDLALEDLENFKRVIKAEFSGSYPLKELNGFLRALKSSYPASDTLILIPDDTVVYETIIQAMDAARTANDNPLFPNVVLSGSLG